MPTAKQRVSYQLLHGNERGEAGHCRGVNVVAVNARGRLYSAGRDASIRCWDVSAARTGVASHLRSFEHHTHWVNDLHLCSANTLASCSSDTSVKLWRVAPDVEQQQPQQDGGSEADESSNSVLATLEGHTDYVKCLAWAPDARVLASAALDRLVCLWDLGHASTPVATFRHLPSASESSPRRATTTQQPVFGQSLLMEKPLAFAKASIYSMCMSTDAGLVLTGGPDKVVKGWDVRGARTCLKLKGHQDIVRRMLLLPGCRQAVTASSDCSVKLWDLGQRRCIDTFALHDDAVWALTANAAGTHVYSGGRDSQVWRTELRTGHSALVAEVAAGPVLGLALAADEDGIWVASDRPEMYLYDVADVGGEEGGQCQRTPLVELPGRPGIVRHHILNNRRQVLSQDTSGAVRLWDVTGTTPMQEVEGEWEAAVEQHTTQQSIPSWFSIDTTLGVLTVRLEESRCFDAVMYPATAGLKDVRAMRINLGERVLECLFRTWKERRQEHLARMRAGTVATTGTEEAPKVEPLPMACVAADGEVEQEDGKEKEVEEEKSQTSPPCIADNSNNGDKPEPGENAEKKEAKEARVTQTADEDSVTKGEAKEEEANEAPEEDGPGREDGSAAASSAGTQTQQAAGADGSEATGLKKTESCASLASVQSDTDADVADLLPRLHLPLDTPVIISEVESGAVWLRTTIEGFRASEFLPAWVSMCLLNGKYKSRLPTSQAKVTFVVKPAPGESFPRRVRASSTISGMRWFQARKIHQHVASCLGCDLPRLACTTAADGSPAFQPASIAPDGAEVRQVKPEEYFELVCKGQVLDPAMDLAAVKAFVWKDFTDIAVEFRRAPAFRDMPMPSTASSKR